MKRYMMMLVAVLVAVAVATPAFAAVEFKYGGQFRARWISQDNFTDGDSDIDDNQNFFDQRLRLYFTFVGSQNLKLVTKFEMGDTRWGNNGAGRIGPGTGGNVGADAVSVEVKNVYVEFNIPCTPTTAYVGVQGINLMNSWIVDEDLSAAIFKSKFDPIVLTLGYVAGQNSITTDEKENVDSFVAAVDYDGGPLKASLVGFYQYGHDTLATVDPLTWGNPIGGQVGGATAAFFGMPATAEDNHFFDLGVNVSYKLDWVSAYLTFVKNLGSVDMTVNGGAEDDKDYTGWMIDAGANFFYGPYTFNVGGFYTTGPDFDENGDFDTDGDIDYFVYPLSTTKYFSEIMGGGILDNAAPVRMNDDDHFWRGYASPTNIWTITLGAAWQVLDKTKLSASYWYFGTSEDVESGNDGVNDEFDSDLGHEFDFYITQGIVDGLTLDIVAAYMATGDAFSENNDDDDVYEVGARIQWNF